MYNASKGVNSDLVSQVYSYIHLICRKQLPLKREIVTFTVSNVFVIFALLSTTAGLLQHPSQLLPLLESTPA